MHVTTDGQNKWNMSERGRKILYDITYLWNLKHGASEPIHETEIESGA